MKSKKMKKSKFFLYSLIALFFISALLYFGLQHKNNSTNQEVASATSGYTTVSEIAFFASSLSVNSTSVKNMDVQDSNSRVYFPTQTPTPNNSFCITDNPSNPKFSSTYKVRCWNKAMEIRIASGASCQTPSQLYYDAYTYCSSSVPTPTSYQYATPTSYQYATPTPTATPINSSKCTGISPEGKNLICRSTCSGMTPYLPGNGYCKTNLSKYPNCCAY